MVRDGTAPRTPQAEDEATYDPMLNKKDLTRIDWTRTAQEIHNFVRGMDSSPGAWGVIEGKEVSPTGGGDPLNAPRPHPLFSFQAKFFGSQLYFGEPPDGVPVAIEGLAAKGVIHRNGLLITDADGDMVSRSSAPRRGGLLSLTREWY